MKEFDMSDKDDKKQTELVGAHVRIFRRGDRWYANFQHDGKQCRVALKTTNKKEARRKAVQIDADLCRGNYEIQTKAPSVSDVIDTYREYLVAEDRAVKTLKKYDHCFKLIRDLVARRKVKSILDVNLAFVDAFRAERKNAGAHSKTIHVDTVVLRQIVNFALARGLITRDPLKGLKLKKPKPTPQPCWSPTEVETIISTANDTHRPALTMLADTGMRVGEIKHLTWADIDFENGITHVRPKEGWKPKSGDIRVIPMTPRIRAPSMSWGRT
jgi:integrase